MSGPNASTKAGIGFTELANGFGSCDDPVALQAICDRLGPADIEAFFERWMAVIPTPLDVADRAGGYWWELSMRQVEMSRTIVFDQPRRARAFFEAVVADNSDLGRPAEVRVIFDRQHLQEHQGHVPHPDRDPRRRCVHGRQLRDSRIKQYLKEGRALRIETVVNAPDDLGCQRRLRNLDELQAKARAANARLLAVQRPARTVPSRRRCSSTSHSPRSRRANGSPALRFGDPRVMALAGALCALVHTVVGFTNGVSAPR